MTDLPREIHTRFPILKSHRMHILILNTHALHAQFLQKALRYENIGADLCRPENLERIWYGQYDALVIPVMHWDRATVMEWVRAITPLKQIPLLFLSKQMPEKTMETLLAEHFPQAEMLGTNLPFESVIKKLKSLQKTHSYEESTQLQAGDLEIDLSTHEVRRQDKLISLRHKEFELLLCLAKNPGKALSRTYLLENVWDRNTSIVTNTVDVHINRLRKKIDSDFDTPLIHTIPCVGYKLVKTTA